MPRPLPWELHCLHALGTTIHQYCFGASWQPIGFEIVPEKFQKRYQSKVHLCRPFCMAFRFPVPFRNWEYHGRGKVPCEDQSVPDQIRGCLTTRVPDHSQGPEKSYMSFRDQQVPYQKRFSQMSRFLWDSTASPQRHVPHSNHFWNVDTNNPNSHSTSHTHIRTSRKLVQHHGDHINSKSSPEQQRLAERAVSGSRPSLQQVALLVLRQHASSRYHGFSGLWMC